MPNNYCLNCAKPAGFHCGCCKGASHYCSVECQKTDWRELHRYEKGLLALGDDTLVVKREPVVKPSYEPRDQKSVWQQEMRRQIERERGEYNETVERTLRHQETLQRGKREMRLTHAQRRELEIVLQGIAPSPEERRAEFRTRFTGAVAALAEAVSPLHKARLGAAEELRLSNLFRRRDLLHAKETLAVATGQLKDAIEARRFGEEVQAAERRFVHDLLLAPLGLRYGEVLARQHQALREAQVERTLDDILDRAFAQTVDVLVEYLQSGRGEGDPLRFSQPFGADDTEDETRRTNLRGLIETLEENNAERGTAFSMQHLNNIAAVARGTYAARQDDAVESGEISAEEHDNSVGFLNDVWRSLADTMRPVAESSNSKNSKGFFKRVRDAVVERVGAVWQSLKNSMIGRVFLVLALIGFLTLAYGICTYTFSTEAQLDKLDAQLGDLETRIDRVETRVDDMDGLITREQEKVASLSRTLDRSQQKAFLDLDANNDNLESATSRILINQNVGNLIEAHEAELNHPDADDLTEASYRPVLNKLHTLQKSTDFNKDREVFKSIQNKIKSGVRINAKSGFMHSIETVDKILDERKEFVDNMGVSAEGIRESLAETREAIVGPDGIRVTVLNARAAAQKTSSGAPFLTSMLRGTGYEFVIDRTMLNPLAELDAQHFGRSNVEPNAYIVSGLQYMGQLEHTAQRALKVANVFSHTMGSLKWFGAIAYSVFTWDFATVLFHALTGVSTLVDVAGAVGDALQYAKRITPEMLQMPVRKISELILGTIGTMLGFGNTEYDSELQQFVDTIKSDDTRSVEDRKAEAMRLYHAGELGGWLEPRVAAIKYGRLIELLCDKPRAYAGDAYLNFVIGSGTEWFQKGVQPALYLTRVIGFYYLAHKYLDLFWNIWYILHYVYLALSWWQIGLFYGALVLAGTLYNKGLASSGFRPPATTVGAGACLVGEALLAPVTALVRLTWNRPYLVMSVAYYTYTTLSVLDTKTGLIRWASPSDKRDETGRNGLAEPAPPLYEAAETKRQMKNALSDGKVQLERFEKKLESGGADIKNISISTTSILRDLLMFADGAEPGSTVLNRVNELVFGQ